MKTEGKNTKTIIFILAMPAIFWAGFCFASEPVPSDHNDFIISEIMYSPVENQDGEKTEWIELYFTSPKSFDLKSKNSKGEYQIKDFYICTKKDSASGNCKNSYPVYALQDKLQIEEGSFVIIAGNPQIFSATYPVSGKEIILKSYFNLLENDDAYLASSVDNKLTWQNKLEYCKFFGKKMAGRSLEKKDVSKGAEDDNWQESYVLGGSPGQKSSEKHKYTKDIQISEILPNPENEDEEFIELFNGSEEEVDLSGWSIEDGTEKPYVIGEIMLKVGEHTAIYKKDYKFALNNSGGEIIILKDPNSEEVDRISYSGSVKEDFAYALKDGAFQWTSTPTPGKENVFTEPETKDSSEENLSTAEKVYLNEILPNPKVSEATGEFIELKNAEDFPVDMYKWMIRDASKTGKYIFKDHVTVNPGEYFVIWRPQFKIALNNSKELITLYNPRGTITSSVAYDKSSENASYNFDGTNWKWSKFLTPGKENKFDKPPIVKIKTPKRAYKNMYAKFQVKAKDKETKNLKYVWDFDDGHKSYLKETSHKYLKTGKYRVLLSVRDESQAVEKTFPLRVRKYPRPKIEITELTPNPSGRDTEFETLVLKNNAGKNVDLKNYKIATGSQNLYNHPISKELVLKPGEERMLTRKESRFTLNNKAGKIQLVYPDGKIADETAYAKEKIKDDETFAKVDGKWQWITPPEEKKNKEKNSNEKIDQENGEVLGASTENQVGYAPLKFEYTSEDAFIFASILKLFGDEQLSDSCRASNTYTGINYLFASLF